MSAQEPLLDGHPYSIEDGVRDVGYKVEFPRLCVLPRCRVCAIFVTFVVTLALCLTVWKEWLEQHGLTSEALLKYVSIPVVSTVFTYCHIWAALYMTFYPLKYLGCLQIPDTNVGCGWQGIVPNRAKQMGIIATENLLKVITVQDIVSRIDPVIVLEELQPVLPALISQITHSMAMEEIPDLWRSLPNIAKNELIDKAREDATASVEGMLREVKEDIETMLDLKEMVAKALMSDPELLNHIFIVTGNDELIFIRNFGATMGLIFGIIQVTMWIFWSAGWMLPTFGFVVGMGTNWIALKMIFEPVEPWPLCGGRIVLQGLFLKRQAEAGAAFSKVVAGNVLSSRNLIKEILTSRSSDKLFEMIHRHICIFCDSYTIKPFVRLLKGTEKLDRCKKSIGNYVINSLSDTMKHAEKYIDASMDLEKILATKMAAMPPADFEQMLHPVFQEDEWKLVLLGGVLGIVVGCCQWWALGS